MRLQWIWGDLYLKDETLLNLESSTHANTNMMACFCASWKGHYHSPHSLKSWHTVVKLKRYVLVITSPILTLFKITLVKLSSLVNATSTLWKLYGSNSFFFPIWDVIFVLSVDSGESMPSIYVLTHLVGVDAIVYRPRGLEILEHPLLQLLR